MRFGNPRDPTLIHSYLLSRTKAGAFVRRGGNDGVIKSRVLGME